MGQRNNTRHYHVELLNFEGPLDLLLQLIEQSKLEITEISLAEVTGQYLRYLDKLSDLDPTELNQFIDLAAKLVSIKSRALLPSLETDEASDDLHELAEQLADYRQYQKASTYLEGLIKQASPSWSRQVQRAVLDLTKLPPTPIATDELKALFDAAIERLPHLPRASLISQVTLADMTERIQASVSQTEPLSLNRLFASLESRLEAAVVFLALLELLRQRQIRVSQDQPFGDIMVMNG